MGRCGIVAGMCHNCSVRSTSSVVAFTFFFFFLFLTLLHSNFSTRRGHRCRPFSPPVLAFDFYRVQGPAIPLPVGFSSSVAQRYAPLVDLENSDARSV